MRSALLYNNLALEALAISLVLNACSTLSVTKTSFILPIVRHQAMLSHLARAGVKVKSFESYFVDNVNLFANFNDRYYDSLTNWINALQLLHDLELVDIPDGRVSQRTTVTLLPAMGKRAKRIDAASQNIAILLEADVETLFLQTRIEL